LLINALHRPCRTSEAEVVGLRYCGFSTPAPRLSRHGDLLGRSTERQRHPLPPRGHALISIAKTANDAVVWELLKGNTAGLRPASDTPVALERQVGTGLLFGHNRPNVLPISRLLCRHNDAPRELLEDLWCFSVQDEKVAAPGSQVAAKRVKRLKDNVHVKRTCISCGENGRLKDVNRYDFGAVTLGPAAGFDKCVIVRQPKIPFNPP